MKDLNQLFGDPKLAKLMAQMQSLTRLEATLQAILPLPLRGVVNCAKLEQGTLTLIAANASYATQIRFSAEAIMMGLNEGLPGQPVKTIRCLVRTMAKKETVTRKIPRRISSAAAENITAAAATISDDKLRRIWERMGQKVS